MLCNGNTNLLKGKAVSCSNSSHITHINDGDYSTLAEFSAGTKNIIFDLGPDYFIKESHICVYIDGTFHQNASLKVYGRNNGGTWYRLGYNNDPQGELCLVKCTGNRTIDEILVQFYTPVSANLKEIVYAQRLETISNLSISPSYGPDVNRLRDGEDLPYLAISGAKHTIYYNLKKDYKHIRININYRNKYYSSANVKIYFLIDGTYQKIIDENIFAESFSPTISSSKQTYKIKIELTGSHNQGNDVSLKEIVIDGVPVDYSINYNKAYNANPGSSYRAMAEWEESEGILINWSDSWTDKENLYIRRIIEKLDNEGKVYVVCNNIEKFIEKMGGDYNYYDNVYIIFVEIDPPMYCKDQMPFGLYHEETQHIVTATIDKNQAQDVIMSYFNLPVYFGPENHYPPDNNHYEGGNFTTDGRNIAIANDSYQGTSNLDRELFIEYLSKLYGCEKQLIVEKYVYGSHVDYFLKIVNEKTIFVRSDAYSNVLPFIESFNQENNTSFEAISLPSSFHSYCNALIFNNSVFVPFSDKGAYDPDNWLVMNTYKQYMPGYKVIPIYHTRLAGTGAGDVHCHTQNIPAKDPVLIQDVQIDDYQGGSSPIPVSAIVKSPSGITSCKLWYKHNQSSAFSSVTMQPVSGTTRYIGQIPYIQGTNTIEYYIEATNGNGKVRTNPYPGYKGAYKFVVGSSSKSSEYSYSNQIISDHITVYPNPVNEYLILDADFEDEISYHLYDLFGKVLISGRCIRTDKIYVSELNAGTYILKLQTQGNDSSLLVKRITIQ